MSKKGDRAFFTLLSFQYKYADLSFDRFMYLYDRLVVPALTYCSEITGWEFGEQYNSSFAKHLSQYLGIYKTINPYVLNWLTGTLPMEFFIWMKSYKFWTALLKLPNERFEKRALISSTYRYLHSEKSWFGSMIAVFDLVDFSGDFVRWTYVDAKLNYMRFSECCSKFLISKMKRIVLDSNKYLFLAKCFGSFENRQFINFSSFQNRRVLAKLFLSLHHFEIESGRWTKTPHNHRFCDDCIVSEFPGLVELGNEEHYLCRCRKFKKERSSVCCRLDSTPDQLLDILSGNFSFSNSKHLAYNCIARFVSVLLQTSCKAYRKSCVKNK